MKTLGLYHLQLPDVGAGGRPPGGALTVHCRTNDLLIKQSTIADGQATCPVRKRA